MITFGKPLVKQVRNEHDLWDDLDLELVNNRATDRFVEILRGVELTEKTYFSALEELLEKSLAESCDLEVYNLEIEMLLGFFEEYLDWCRVIKGVI